MPGNPFANTTYGGGSINTRTGGLDLPMGGGMGNVGAQLEALMDLKLRQARKAVAGPKTTPFGAVSLGAAPTRPAQYAAPAGERVMQPHLSPEDRGMVANYIKPITNLHMGSGYMKADPWEQNAVFSGYSRPRGK